MIRQSQFKTFTPSGTTWAVLLIGTLLMSPVTLDAQSVSKIGVINLAQAVETSTEGRKAAEQWTTRMTERTVEIQAKQQELVALQQKAQTPAPETSEAELLQLNREVERLTTDLSRLNEDIDSELNALRQETVDSDHREGRPGYRSLCPGKRFYADYRLVQPAERPDLHTGYRRHHDRDHPPRGRHVDGASPSWTGRWTPPLD